MVEGDSVRDRVPVHAELGEIAVGLADAAGNLLLEMRHGGLTGPALRESGDRVSHEFLVSELARRCPGDAVLSEEGRDDGARLGASRVWIIDPLDGTREFSEPPRWDWAVHIALVVDGELTVGAVALPARGMSFHTSKPPRLPPMQPGVTRMLVSRTRAPGWATDVARGLGAKIVRMGSAGAKAMAVVLGEAEIYVHAGGQYEWDSAAPVAIARAAGLHASRLDGSSLRYNQPDPWLPDLLICRREIAATALELCRRWCE